MVVLIISGCYMPALIKSHNIVFIAGIVAACTDLTFAVADFNHIYTGVDNAVPVSEIGEGAEGGAGVI